MFHRDPVNRGNVDTLTKRMGWIFLAPVLIGCGSARATPPDLPPPMLPPPPIVTAPSAGFWIFNYTPGTIRYQVSRSAVIESQSDSANNREVSTNITHELITLVPASGDSGISFTAVVDTFSTTAQGLIGPVQPFQLPVQVEGVFTAGKLAIESDSTSSKCNPISSALVSDLHNLLTGFPAPLSQGQVWQDSVTTTGCQAAIPTASQVVRSFVVSGEANYEGQPVLLVQRSDSIHGCGEGAQLQHRLSLDASGTGSAVYYLNTKDGRVVRLTAEQELNLAITTSAKAYQFKQKSTQDFRLMR